MKGRKEEAENLRLIRDNERNRKDFVTLIAQKKGYSRRQKYENPRKKRKDLSLG